MIIRQAVARDAAAVRVISEENKISRDSHLRVGFVEYNTPDEELYVRYITDNPYFYVAEQDQQVVGFLSAFETSFLYHMHAAGDEIVQYILGKSGSLLYVDQLAVKRDLHKQGIGTKLMKRWEKDAAANGIPEAWYAVSSAPIFNEVSRKLIQRFGFVFDETITVYNGLDFDLFRKVF